MQAQGSCNASVMIGGFSGPTKNMKSLSPVALAFLLLSPALTAGQGKPTLISLSEYQKKEWHVEDGLPQGNVRAIAQAPDRSLMIGTSEGISSFDGIRFTPFPLRSANGPKNEPVNFVLYS